MSKKILTLDNVPVINKKIGKIDTIEKLKASTIYSIGDVVEVLGFYAKGDGSHHKRVAKAEDDGSGELGQGGIWWCIVHNGEVNVSWFGAKGDGVTDDTLVLQKSIDYVELLYKEQTINREVLVEHLTHKGTLYISKPVEIKTHTSIISMSIKCLGSFTGDDILFTDSSRILGSFLNLNIDANGTEAKRCFRMQNVFGSKIQNLNVVNFKHTGFLSEIGGYELFMDNARFTAHKDAVLGSIGLHVKMGDGHYTNVVSTFTNIGVLVEGGSNIFDKIHTWSGYYANGRDSGISGGVEQRVGFYIKAGDNTFSNCQSDSPSKNNYSKPNEEVMQDGYINGGVGFFIDDAGYRNKFVNCVLVSNTTLYDKASSSESVARGEKQILPYFVKGRDNSFLNFRNPIKKEVSKGKFFSNDIRCSNTIIGNDNVGSLLYSRADFSEDALTLISVLSNALSILGGDSLTKVLSIKSVGNYGVEIVGKAQTIFKNADNINNYVRLFSSATSTSLEPIGNSTLGRVEFPFSKVSAKEIVMVRDDGSNYTFVVDANGNFVKKGSLTALDTPYYTLKMQQDGIYADYVAYRDELHEYENSQTSGDTMMLTVLQEPEIPESVKQFAEKYKLI